MIPLSNTIKLAKNKLNDPYPFITLVGVTLPDDSVPTIFLAANNASVIYGSNTYVPFPFTLDQEREASDGSLPTRTLTVSNINLALNPALDSTSGLVEGRIEVIEVYANTSPATLVKSQIYDVLSTSANGTSVTLMLGMADPLRQQHPAYNAYANVCQWKFKGEECRYDYALIGTGTDYTNLGCDKSVIDCEARLNSKNYGGRPGLTDPYDRY
jgi:phage-related protein